MLPVIARGFSSVAISVFLNGWRLLRFARNDKSGLFQRSHCKANPIIFKTTRGLCPMLVFCLTAPLGLSHGAQVLNNTL